MIYGIVSKTRTRRLQRCEKTLPLELTIVFDCSPCHPLCIVSEHASNTNLYFNYTCGSVNTSSYAEMNSQSTLVLTE